MIQRTAHTHRLSPIRVRSALTLLCALALALVPAVASADHHEGDAEHDHAAGTDLATVLMGDFDRASSHFVELAEAIPAEHYSWRPAEGVRSVSETLMHVAGANYGLGQALGTEPEGGMMERADLEMLEEITDRDAALAKLNESVAFAKAAIEGATGKSGDEMLPAFGTEMPRSRVLMILDTHMHEHLGQLIAYARSNGVVPPWSQ